MLIEAEGKFPHKVVPLAFCLACKRKLTIVLPANTDISEVACKCGERRLMVKNGGTDV